MIFAFDIRQARPEQTVFLLLLALVSGVCLARFIHGKPKDQVPTDPLEYPLFTWQQGDPFPVRDMVAGGVVIMGRTSSGKSSGSGDHLLRSIVNYPKSGGLICAAKPEEADDVRAVFAAAGRSDDLIVFNPDGEMRFNFIDYVRRMGGDTREITKCITTIGETLRASDTKGGGEMGDFWENEQARLIHNAVEIVKLATGKVTAPDLQKFITTALQTPQQVSAPEWAGCFHDKCMRAAHEAKKSAIEQHDFQLAVDYWFREYPTMASKTRSSILTGVLGILHVFNSGLTRELCSTTTNVSPDDMLEGRWVLVNMPPAVYGDMGNFVNAGWKYLTQRMVLKRRFTPGECINVIWCDEYQQFANSFDSHYLAQCRSHGGCMVVLTQSMHSIFAAMKGESGKHQAQALLTNFHHKIFHALGDAQTAEWASSHCGKELQTQIGGSMPPEESIFDAVLGKSKFQASFSESWQPVIQPNVFMNGLRTGGKANGFLTDAIVIKSGEPFANGKNWRFVTFSQK